MPPKPLLYAPAALVVVAMLVSTAVRGAPDTAGEWLTPIAPAVAIAGLALLVFDRWAWRWRGIRNLSGRPLLHGTWHGSLASDWVDPATGKRIAPDPDVFLVVRQRFWHASVRLLTKESSSASVLAEFKADGDGVHQLLYLYANTPRPDFRHRSELHFGAVVLGAPQDSSQGLEGHYFTDRKDRGEMRFSQHYEELVETHAAGRTLVASANASA